jgi:hypothetical protein
MSTNGGGSSPRQKGNVVLWLVYLIWAISKSISLGYWLLKLLTRLHDSDGLRNQFYGGYIFGWLLALGAILMFAPPSGFWGLAFGGLALYRLQDLLIGSVGDALEFHDFAGTWQVRTVQAIVNIIQVVTIFAIAYLVFTSSNSFSPTEPSGRLGHFYLSWSCIPLLGSGFMAETFGARWLVMIESAAAVLLTVIALSRFLAGLPRPKSTRPSANTPPPAPAAAHTPAPKSAA